MPDDFSAVLALTHAKVTRLLEVQCVTAGDRNCGGFITDESGYADSRGSIYEGMNLFAAYLCPHFSSWYAAPALLNRIHLLLGFMARRQRKNGTVMLGTSAAPGCAEVGFTLPGVCATYERIAASTVPGRDDILAALGTYIQRGAEACRNLRPHTANHRWTACIGPLAWVDRLFPHPDNQARIQEFLSDGIDCDRDGFWFEERSPNYNNVANWGMLYLADHAQTVDNRQFLEAAYRNYRNILHFIQPNGEADSTFSHRQDRGQAGCTWGDWWLCKRLAVEFNDGELAQVADDLLAGIKSHVSAFVPLLFLIDAPRFREEAIPRKPIPKSGELRAREQPIWRWRNESIAATVIADHGDHFWDATYGHWGARQRSNTVMSLHHGLAIIDGIKLTWGSGSGGFRPEHILYLNSGSMQLDYQDQGQDHIAHFRPPGKRDPVNLPYDQHASLRIDPLPGGKFRLHIDITGEPDVHINVQFLLRELSQLRAPNGCVIDLAPGERTFTLSSGDHTVRGPDGCAWRIHGLPVSEHRVGTGDGSHIGGQAERRCHRLIVGGFTPFHAVVDLIPETLPG